MNNAKLQPATRTTTSVLVTLPMNRVPAFKIMAQWFLQGPGREDAEFAQMLHALDRLLEVAMRPTHQGFFVATFLAALYNKYEFFCNVVELRGGDDEIFRDCMAVLRLNRVCGCEIHLLLPDGNKVWRQMIGVHSGLIGNARGQDGAIMTA